MKISSDNLSHIEDQTGNILVLNFSYHNSAMCGCVYVFMWGYMFKYIRLVLLGSWVAMVRKKLQGIRHSVSEDDCYW